MIKEVMFVNMRDIGPTMFALREDYTFSCMASYIESKGYKTNMYCGDYRYLSNVNYCKLNPDLIIFSLDFLDAKVIDLIDYYKKIFNSKPIIVAGGNFATNHVKELLDNYRQFDYILLGEGEPALFSLLDWINNKGNLYGVAMRDEDRIEIFAPSKNEIELDDLPFAKRQVLKDNNLSMAYIASSRGCTRNCSFCSNHVFWKPVNGKLWKGRTAKNVVDEIEELISKGIKIFNFVDSSFEDPGVANKRMQAFAKEILRRNIKIGFFVNFCITVILNEDFEESLDLLVKAGLLGVFIGVETGNENDKKIYKKEVGKELSIKAYNFFKQKGLSVTCGFINFNPYSTIDTLRENNDLIRKLNLGGYFLFRSKLRVYKGTLMYEQIKNDGLLLCNKFYTYDFKFVDKKVEKISKTLESFLQNEQYRKVVNDFRYFSKYYEQNIQILKFLYPEVNEFITKEQIKLEGIVAEWSKVHCDMFDKLLEYSENNEIYDENVALNIVKDINLDKAKKQINQLKKGKLFIDKMTQRNERIEKNE